MCHCFWIWSRSLDSILDMVPVQSGKKAAKVNNRAPWWSPMTVNQGLSTQWWAGFRFLCVNNCVSDRFSNQLIQGCSSMTSYSKTDLSQMGANWQFWFWSWKKDWENCQCSILPPPLPKRLLIRTTCLLQIDRHLVNTRNRFPRLKKSWLHTMLLHNTRSNEFMRLQQSVVI